jgi:hypothetical protein
LTKEHQELVNKREVLTKEHRELNLKCNKLLAGNSRLSSENTNLKEAALSLRNQAFGKKKIKLRIAPVSKA